MKKYGALKQFVLLLAPFLLYFVAVVFIAIFLFLSFVQENPVWRVIMAGTVETTEDSEIDHEIDYVQPEPIVDVNENEEKVYYDINRFPRIKWGKKWATLSIDFLGAVDVPVYEGDTENVLNYGIAHYFSSKLPGQDGNCVLSFHVNRQKQLYYLEDVPIGEKIIIKASYGTYVYEIVSKDIFERDDTTLIFRDEGEMLTLYTCYPKEGPYRKQRFAVTALLVEKESDPTWR